MIKNKYIIQILLDDLQGEYDAINLYNRHIDGLEEGDIKHTLIHIRDEELEHVEELKVLINKYQYKLKTSRLNHKK